MSRFSSLYIALAANVVFLAMPYVTRAASPPMSSRCPGTLKDIVAMTKTRPPVTATLLSGAGGPRCLRTTRFVLRSAINNDLLSILGAHGLALVENIELKQGAVDLANRRFDSARLRLGDAVADETLLSTTSNQPDFAIPNAALTELAKRNFLLSFERYAYVYTSERMLTDFDWMDKGYYERLTSALVSASRGEYAESKSTLEQCVKIEGAGSDAWFFLGAVSYAMDDDESAVASWISSINVSSAFQDATPHYDNTFASNGGYMLLIMLRNEYRGKLRHKMPPPSLLGPFSRNR